MALRKGKWVNQYDFSGGINISQPGYLIEDNECYSNVSTYQGTRNCYWDLGIKKRKGMVKTNSIAVGPVVSGFRHYRSSDPERTTFVASHEIGETKLYYLGSGNEFIELYAPNPDSEIDEESFVTFTKWKDNLYAASGNTKLQRIRHDGMSWIREDITELSWEPQFVIHHRDRLWAAGGNMPMGYLECTGYEFDDDWAGTEGYAFNVGFKDGDPITALLPMGNALIIYKNDSIYGMAGDNVQNWYQEKLNGTIGCVATKSVADTGVGHIFLGADNIYHFDGQNVTPIGNKVKPWLNAIPSNFRKNATAVYHDGYYRLAIASSTSYGDNDIELLLDMKNFSRGQLTWWMNDGRNIGFYVPYAGPQDNNELYMLDTNQGYLFQMETGTTDDGSPVKMEFHSKYFTFGQPNVEKGFDRIKIDSGLGVGSINFTVYRNLSDDATLPINIDLNAGIATFGTAVMGETMFTSKGNARRTTEIALPADMDGYSLSYSVKHYTTEENVAFYGFSLVYGYKSF